MEIPFWKMHGAANDFIMVDDREMKFPTENHEWISQIATRRTGIGCEGVILIQPSESSDFRMRFFNPDGNEVEMCGNGARCAAQLAHEIGAAPDSMTIETVAGQLRATTLGNRVKLWMTNPKDWRMNQKLTVHDEELVYHFVNSGVPHVVIVVDVVTAVDVKNLGSEIRHHELFKPAGTNVNFIHVTGPDSLRIRTYERGVEEETLACGTGMVAAGLIAGKLGLVKPPVQITCASGDVLEVDYTLTDDGAKDVTLTGPAVHVYQGTLVSV